MSGKNILSAVVWNMGEQTPASQISHGTAFRLQAASDQLKDVDSGPEWRVTKCSAYTALPAPRDEIPYYYVVGPGDRIDAAEMPWGWCDAGFDDSSWSIPATLANEDCPWQLAPAHDPHVGTKANSIRERATVGGHSNLARFSQRQGSYHNTRHV